MRMKYVMLQVKRGDTLRRIPVLFPELVNHDDMATASLLSGGDAFRGAEVVSAGFVVLTGASCHGRSESLGVPSHPDDSRIMESYDYCHGIVPNQSQV